MTATLDPLPHIRDVDVMKPEFRADVAKIGTLFAWRGLVRRYTAQAGHRHFNMRPDETLLEEIGSCVKIGACVLRTRVVFLDQVSDKLAVAWRFTKKGKAIATAWRAPSDIPDAGVADLDYQVGLTKIGTFFARRGLTSRFTVGRRCFNLAPDEALRERTNEESRTQELWVIPRAEVRAERAATWGFTEEGEPVVEADCTWYHRQHG